LPIAHSGRVFKAWITISGTYSISFYSTHKQKWISKAVIEFE
jgi:hypothetical protein